jgi:endonuclease VIII
MPEVIEVKKYTDFIRRRVLHKQLMQIVVQGGRYKKHGFDHIQYIKLPSKVTIVENKGKFMYIGFQSGQFIGVTLGLSGGWMFRSNRNKRLECGLDPTYDITEQNIQENHYLQTEIRHINVIFTFSNGELYFYDMLSFGTIKLFSSQEELYKKLQTLGPDIMDPEFQVSLFENNLNKYFDNPIGNVLMNQRVISGVGNYLRADALWLAKISPFRKVKDIESSELKRLFHFLRSLIWNQYNRKRGIFLGIVKRRDKRPEDYGRHFFVYQEDTDIYGNPIFKQKLHEGSQVRYIYWVKDIQT